MVDTLRMKRRELLLLIIALKPLALACMPGKRPRLQQQQLASKKGVPELLCSYLVYLSPGMSQARLTVASKIWDMKKRR